MYYEKMICLVEQKISIYRIRILAVQDLNDWGKLQIPENVKFLALLRRLLWNFF